MVGSIKLRLSVPRIGGVLSVEVPVSTIVDSASVYDITDFNVTQNSAGLAFVWGATNDEYRQWSFELNLSDSRAAELEFVVQQCKKIQSQLAVQPPSWSNSTAYSAGEIVYWPGGSSALLAGFYYCTNSSPVGQLPSNTNYWQRAVLVAEDYYAHVNDLGSRTRPLAAGATEEIRTDGVSYYARWFVGLTNYESMKKGSFLRNTIKISFRSLFRGTP